MHMWQMACIGGHSSPCGLAAAKDRKPPQRALMNEIAGPRVGACGHPLGTRGERQVEPFVW